MYSATFVLLYYKAYQDTIECIESIKNLEQNSVRINIVLVDNNSNDGSFEKLKKTYADHLSIHWISTGANLGYAKGNNVGVKYAKTQLKSDWVIILNTDVVIRQKDFCEKIVELYNKEHYYVLGPEVLGYSDGLSQSPLQKRDSMNIYKVWINNMLHLIAWKTNLIVVIRKFRKRAVVNFSKPTEEEKYTCICHGSCLILSPIFLERFNGFDGRTFLYREESILFYVLHKLGLKTLFSDELTAFHKGGKSSEAEYGKGERNKAIPACRIRNESLLEEIRVRHLSMDKLEDVLK